MAPGVGKTFAMLNEGRRRHERGTDVVAGFIETYNRPRTIEAIGDLEVIPRKQVEYKGVVLEEMDTDAVIARKPQVALVDELAHTNAPGSRNEKRWQDVQELLDAGVTVISTVNIQHVESLADIVQTITGVLVRERIPDSVIDGADEVEVVDMSAHALRQRIRHGNVYPKERADQALASFFREGNLNALRELALRQVATNVEQDLEEYMRDHHIEETWPAGERVLAAVNGGPESQRVLRRAWRLADRLQADLIAVFIEPSGWEKESEARRQTAEQNLAYARELGAEVVEAKGSDIVETLRKVAHEKNAASIVIGKSAGSSKGLFKKSATERLLELADEVDVYIVGGR
jgi:two-component system sensor histidine kinase KdpD